MKLVIDIPEAIYNTLQKRSTEIQAEGYTLENAVLNGTPLVNPQEKKWIPISKKLPEEGIDVLVWYRYWRYGDYNNWYYTYGIGYLFDDYWSVINGGTQITVYAWQKLPKPYNLQERRKDENKHKAD